jgi:hypothetical protein
MEQLELSNLFMASFEMGGTGPNSYDCFTLSKEVLRRAGIDLPSWESIQDIAARDFIINERKQFFTRLETPKPFCLVSFKLHGPLVTHIGVVLEDCKTFIHIMKKQGVSICRLDDIIWSKKIDGFYQYNSGC